MRFLFCDSIQHEVVEVLQQIYACCYQPSGVFYQQMPATIWHAAWGLVICKPNQSHLILDLLPTTEYHADPLEPIINYEYPYTAMFGQDNH